MLNFFNVIISSYFYNLILISSPKELILLVMTFIIQIQSIFFNIFIILIENIKELMVFLFFDFCVYSFDYLCSEFLCTAKFINFFVILLLLFVFYFGMQLVLTNMDPVYNLFGLILFFFTGGLIFICLGFDFLGFILIIIYVGSIVILFLFVIMLLDIRVDYFAYKVTRFDLNSMSIFQKFGDVVCFSLFIVSFIFLVINILYLLLFDINSSLSFNNFNFDDESINNYNSPFIYHIINNYYITKVGQIFYVFYFICFFVLTCILFVALVIAVILTSKQSLYILLLNEK